MSTVARSVLVLVVVATLGCAALIATLAAHGLGSGDLHVIVNDREWQLGELSGWHSLGAGFGLLVAIAAVAIVVLMLLFLGLMMPLLLVTVAALLAFAALLGVGALAMLPLLLPLAIVWGLWRRSRRRQAAAVASNTIDA